VNTTNEPYSTPCKHAIKHACKNYQALALLKLPSLHLWHHKNLLYCILYKCTDKKKAFIRLIVEAVGRLSSGVTNAKQP